MKAKDVLVKVWGAPIISLEKFEWSYNNKKKEKRNALSWI